MSIIPVGNRKDQVKQGPLRNQSILDSVLFKKFAQGIESTLAPDKPKNSVHTELDDVMMQGGLNVLDQANRLEHNVDPLNQTPASPQGVMPSGSRSPASQFLGQDTDTEGQQTDPNTLWQTERQKIRNFIGNDFGMKLTQNSDGTFTVTIKPPGNAPVKDPSGFIDALLQYIGGGIVNEEDTPAVSDAGGALTLKYRPSGAPPQKIRKGKGGR